jgi:hypothetical protein
MSAAGLVVSLLIAALGAAWILLPVIRDARRRGVAGTRERDELLTLYERVLSAIRDLDEDFLTGKLDQETYQEERAEWSRRGIQTLRRLEEMGITGSAAPAAGLNKDSTAQEDELEAAVARYVKSRVVS